MYIFSSTELNGHQKTKTAVRAKRKLSLTMAIMTSRFFSQSESLRSYDQIGDTHKISSN